MSDDKPTISKVDIRNLCIVCGYEIIGDGTEWADWTELCEDCECEQEELRDNDI